jgi:hypothetical protein
MRRVIVIGQLASWRVTEMTPALRGWSLTNAQAAADRSATRWLEVPQ